MNKMITILLLFIMNSLSTVNATEISESQQRQIIQSAANVVSKIFEASNNKQFLQGLDYYSDDKNAFFVSAGSIQSLSDLKISYAAAGAGVEELHNEILEWNSKVLSPELISFTLPVRLRLKLKGIEEYTGTIIWSAILQKTDDQWLVVQSHESWLNAAEVAQALNPQQ